MEQSSFYKTVTHPGAAEHIDRRSRFLGLCAPAAGEAEIQEHLVRIRKEHRDAAHHVYGYRLRAGHIDRFSDDGEPNGTAGMPVLDMLSKSGLTDTLVVVTRYFGGILLGTGGLVHAYSAAASAAIAAAGPAVMRRCAVCAVSMPYTQYGRIGALLAGLAAIEDTVYTDTVTVHLSLPREDLPALQKQLTEASAGQLTAVTTGEKWVAFENSQ
ncbi:MAG: YigZ family protein [Oscillospiraceae bacterium]|nr:YigZ family protein [Oscillospiraceae bacterium]